MAFRSHRGAACAQILRSRGQEGHRDDKKAMVCPFLGEPLLGSAGAAYHLTGSRGACCAAPFGGCTNRCLGGACCAAPFGGLPPIESFSRLKFVEIWTFLYALICTSLGAHATCFGSHALSSTWHAANTHWLVPWVVVTWSSGFTVI